MRHLIKRTIAYFIDCSICYLLIMLIIQWALMSNLRESIGLTNKWFQNSINLELYVLLTISLPIWSYFIYFDSNRANGTIGKRIMHLSVNDHKKEKIGIRKSFLRTMAKLLPWELAHIGVVFPTPLYFSQNPDIRLLIILGISLFLCYGLSILIDSNRQSIYDKLLGTIVMEK